MIAALPRTVADGIARQQAAAQYRKPRALRADRPAASGLVNSSTSDTRPSGPIDLRPDRNADVIELDRDAGRLRKMRARVLEASSVHESDRGELQPAMVTLTYADMGAWSPRHVSEALKRCRQWLARRGHRMRYVWVAELQERGAIHYHVLAWFPRSKDRPPFWDQQGWWPHGASRSEWAEKPVGYMVKYVSKVGSKDRLPCGARMHGSGGFLLDEKARMSWHARPSWLRQLSSAMQHVKRRTGGGWVQKFACGLRVVQRSPYVVLRTGGKVILALKDSATGRHADALHNLRLEHAHSMG